jgi:Transposase IS116/IS110/IS902 family
MTVPGIGPIISSAVVAAIDDGTGFKQGRDFGAWLGLVPRQSTRQGLQAGVTKRTLFVQAAMSSSPADRARQVGRPSSYKPEYAKMAKHVAKLGATDKDLGQKIQHDASALRLHAIDAAQRLLVGVSGVNARGCLTKASCYR